MQNQFCIVLSAKTKDVLGTHHVSSRIFAASYLKHGFTPVFLDVTDPASSKQLITLLQRKPAFVHCEQSHGLNLAITETKQNIYEYFNVPVVAHLRDFPFCNWVRESVTKMSRTGLLFHTDREAVEMACRMGAAKETQKFAPHVYLDYDYYPENSVQPPSKRSIPLMYVGSYRNPEIFRNQFLELFPSREKLFDRCVEAGVSNYRKSIHHIVEECLAGEDIEIDYKAEKFLDFLFFINQFIRYERRRLLLNKMALYPVHVVWAGEVPSLGGNIKADIRSRATLKETFSLMEQSRAMIMTLNNFSYSLSERLLTAMHRNCVVISQSNAMIDEVFTNDEDIMLLDDNLENFDIVIEKSRDDSQVDGLAEKAFETVRATYSPDIRVNEFLKILDIRD